MRADRPSRQDEDPCWRDHLGSGSLVSLQKCPEAGMVADGITSL